MIIQTHVDPFVQHMKKIKGEDYSPEIILEVGSCDLQQSIELGTSFPDAKIYSFEPNPPQYEICNKRARNFPNIKVYNEAVSDADGEVDFYRTLGNVGASSLLEPIDIPYAWTKEVVKTTVKCTTLKTWIEKEGLSKIDAIWMDAQGMELAAFKGMGEHLKNVKFIHCEAAEKPYYVGHLLKSELEEFLISMGFEMIWVPNPPHPYGEGDIIATNKFI